MWWTLHIFLPIITHSLCGSAKGYFQYSIWRYLMVLCSPSHNHMETLRSNFEYRKISSIPSKYWVLRIELVSIHNTVKYPRQLLGTMWEHISYRWKALASLNTQIIQHALRFDKHGEWELFKSRQNTNIPATTVDYPGIWRYFGCQHLLLNTLKYRQIAYGN